MLSIPMAPSSEIFIDDILKKSLIFKEKRLDLIGRESNKNDYYYPINHITTTSSYFFPLYSKEKSDVASTADW